MRFSVLLTKKLRIPKQRLQHYVQIYPENNLVEHLKTLMRCRNWNKCRIHCKILIIPLDCIGNSIICLKKKKMELVEILRMKLHNFLVMKMQNQRSSIMICIMNFNNYFDCENITFFRWYLWYFFYSLLFKNIFRTKIELYLKLISDQFI